MSEMIRSRLRGAFVCACVMVFASRGSAQAMQKALVPGSMAPEIHLSKTYGKGTQAKISLSSLRGKVVVLEFWATWCAPCLGEFKAMDVLAKSLDPSKVVLLSITDEDEATVEKFIRRRPVPGTVGIDPEGKTFGQYSVEGRPATFVIGSDGRIVSTDLHPHQLSALQLMKLARKGARSLSESGDATLKRDAERETTRAFKEQLARESGAEKTHDALFRISLTKGLPDAQPHVVKGKSSNLVDYLNLPLNELLKQALGLSSVRLDIDESVPNRKYSLSVHAEGAPDDKLRLALELAIAAGVGVNLQHTLRDEDVYYLTRAESYSPKQVSMDRPLDLAYYAPDKAEFGMLGATSKQIAVAAEEVLNAPVIDHSEGASCDARVPLSSRDPSAVSEALLRACGLQLSKGRGGVDHLRVSAASRHSE